MIGMTIGLVIYLAVGRYIAGLVDTEDILFDTLVMLYWPLVVILAIFVFMFWG